jgi:malate/lactate dehydrogenase
MFWVRRVAEYFEKNSYDVACEHPVKGNGAIDILAQRPGERIAVEVETGKSNVKENLLKIKDAGFDRVILVATSPAAVAACQRVAASFESDKSRIEQLTWLDLG